MIKAPSLVAEHTLIFSGDPALNLPEDPAEAASALEQARETNQWQALIREGESPTLFHVRPLYGTLWDWLAGEVNRRQLSQAEQWPFALRLALRRVENFGSYKVSHTKIDGHSMATTEIIDAIYTEGGGAGRQIVEELGSLVIIKATQGLRPKS